MTCEEFCYNMHYVQLNGRNRGDPWSLRQYGVYHQINARKKSTWILLQPSGEMRIELEQLLRNNNHTNDTLAIDPIVPHLIFMSTVALNWLPHIESLNAQLIIFVRSFNEGEWVMCLINDLLGRKGLFLAGRISKFS